MYLSLADGTSTIVAGGVGRTGSLITATPDGRMVLFARQDYSCRVHAPLRTHTFAEQRADLQASVHRDREVRRGFAPARRR